MYIYGVVLTECGGDDGLLDSAIHHQPHAQAQQQRGNIITIQCLVCTCFSNSSLGNTNIEQTWEMLQHCAPPEKPMCKPQSQIQVPAKAREPQGRTTWEWSGSRGRLRRNKTAHPGPGISWSTAVGVVVVSGSLSQGMDSGTWARS